VGCGNIAGGFDMARPAEAWPVTQAGAFRRHGGFELAACVDPLELVRAEFAQHWKIPLNAPSIDALGAQCGDFDVISLCSPTALHHEHLEAALKLAPRLIFCEKPLTQSVALSRDWIRACADQDVRLVVNYTRQWDPSVAKLVDELRAGVWGSIRSAVGFYNKGVLNNGGHLIDLLLRILGPLDVVAATAPVCDHWDEDPTVAGLLLSEAGRVPVSLNPAHAEDYALFELELVCELGVIRMRDGGLNWEVRRTKYSSHFKGYHALADAELSEGGYTQAMTQAATEIYDFLNHGQALRGTGESALAVQMICDQLLVAATNATPSTI
jgi:predicted dehydrogenase